MSSFFFLSTILSVYAAINFYLLLRLWMTLSGTGLLRVVGCVVILLLALCFPLGQTLAQKAPGRLSSALLITAYFYIAPMFYGFFFTAAADILRLLNKIITITPLPPPFTIGGRIATVSAVVLLSLGVSLAGAINARFPAVVRKSIAYQGDSPLRIAVISDLHLGRIVGLGHLKRVLSLLRNERADILLLAGDILDDASWLSNDRVMEETRALFAAVSPRLGIWAVPGNHEYYAGIERYRQFLDRMNIPLLLDKWALPGGELLLIGRDDRAGARFNVHRADLRTLFGEARRDAAADVAILPIVVMDHQPFDLHEAEELGATLQVSGHTHRGQLFPFNFFTAWMYEKHYGLYRRANTHYYISSGAGTWGPPVRTTGRPEVVIIELAN